MEQDQEKTEYIGIVDYEFDPETGKIRRTEPLLPLTGGIIWPPKGP